MTRQAQITIQKCMKTGKLFGIRWEKTVNDIWEATWSFKIPASQKESDARKSGSTISGQFHFPPTYPGCPHCHGKVNVRCTSCGGLYCHDMDKGTQTRCPWCNEAGQLAGGGAKEIRIQGRQDR